MVKFKKLLLFSLVFGIVANCQAGCFDGDNSLVNRMSGYLNKENLAFGAKALYLVVLCARPLPCLYEAYNSGISNTLIGIRNRIKNRISELCKKENLKYYVEPAAIAALCVGLYAAREKLDPLPEDASVEDMCQRYLKWGACERGRWFRDLAENPKNWPYLFIKNFTAAFSHTDSSHLRSNILMLEMCYLKNGLVNNGKSLLTPYLSIGLLSSMLTNYNREGRVVYLGASNCILGITLYLMWKKFKTIYKEVNNQDIKNIEFLRSYMLLYELQSKVEDNSLRVNIVMHPYVLSTTIAYIALEELYNFYKSNKLQNCDSDDVRDISLESCEEGYGDVRQIELYGFGSHDGY